MSDSWLCELRGGLLQFHTTLEGARRGSPVASRRDEFGIPVAWRVALPGDVIEARVVRPSREVIAEWERRRTANEP